jgi:hypothetical protein
VAWEAGTDDGISVDAADFWNALLFEALKSEQIFDEQNVVSQAEPHATAMVVAR